VQRPTSKSLIHDVAWQTTKEAFSVVAPAFREEQWADALSEIYEKIRAGMELYHSKLVWLGTRIGSSY
jgi:hypothetical protein